MHLVNEMSTFILPFLWISNTTYVFVSYVNGERETGMSRRDNCRNMLYVMFVDFFLEQSSSILTRDVA